MKLHMFQLSLNAGARNGRVRSLLRAAECQSLCTNRPGRFSSACVSVFAAIVVTLALAGCSTPAKVDHGPIHAKTFSFVDRGTKPLPAQTDNRQDVHALVQQAITKNLAAKGITKAPHGDVTV